MIQNMKQREVQINGNAFILCIGFKGRVTLHSAVSLIQRAKFS